MTIALDNRIPPLAFEAAWRGRPAAQQPTWPDPDHIAAVTAELAAGPPLVLPEECDLLTGWMAEVAAGRAFLLQGGDCAEPLPPSTESVCGTLSTLLQMAQPVGLRTEVPVVTLARMAGQHAKPRSRDTEIIDGVELPSYRGDSVNGAEFTPAARRPDASRLLRAHQASASTLNLVRAFVASGAARPEALHARTGGYLAGAAGRERHRPLWDAVGQSLAEGAAESGAPVFVSHEGLLLDYESALSRVDPRTGRVYATSAHLLWIGERTRHPGGAHVEFFSQVSNPLAVKIGPTATPEDLLRLVDRLDPHREPGRLTFVARLGAANAERLLPGLLEAAGEHHGWLCDPMHGNTVGSASGHKTRRLADLLAELAAFVRAHADLGRRPGGVHLELTGNDVTECVGGSRMVAEDDLPERFTSLCDPRLNGDQSLDLAFEMAEMMAMNR